MEDGDSLSPESVGENSSCFNPYTSRALIMGGRVEFDVELRLYMSVVPKPVRPVNSVPPFKYPGVYGPYHNWLSESTLNSLVSFDPSCSSSAKYMKMKFFSSEPTVAVKDKPSEMTAVLKTAWGTVNVPLSVLLMSSSVLTVVHPIRFALAYQMRS